MRHLLLILLTGLLVLTLLPVPADGQFVPSSPASPNAQIDLIIAALSPKERIGQLLLVTFEGSYLGPETTIAQLITTYNIGGVVLLAENDNINGQVNTPRLVLSLTNDLQRIAYEATRNSEGRDDARPFVPLFIATTHAGDGQPNTQIATGTTPLPSLLALGATWNTDYAQQVGQIAGSELSAMGINLLLGPALDVLQRPQAERALDLGVNTFGGDPFWVGQMGQAYIAGVHQGSQNRIAVIAQDFPGLGFADTDPAQEIPVVPRSVDELSQFDLVPFAAVTGGADNTDERADGIQCANLRYQGENIRSITRPVCVDERAAGQLLGLDDFRAWREQGGIMVSAPLGTPAIRRYYNTTPFPHRQVAREAFLAGNDLLYLNNFGAQPGEDQFANVIDVIDFFTERYQNDPVFRDQVDRSLERILRLKLKLYDGDLSYAHVQTSLNNVDNVGQATAALYGIAQQSTTLIAPRPESLPPPPTRNDMIVIFTDVRLAQQCSFCPAYPIVQVNGLEVAIERMYGPYAGAQIRPEKVVSFSFSQLEAYLAGNLEAFSDEANEFRTNQRIGEALRAVDWIVFVMLDMSPNYPASGIVRQFLQEETRLVEQSRVVVIALGSPVYLSSTEISKVAAYYGLYSNISPHVDAAARALFQETALTGALPISLPAIGYDLAEVTAPNPTQIIQLEIASLNGQPVDLLESSVDLPMVAPGERLTVRTGPLLDHNGHRVPDNTPVEFTLTLVADNLENHHVATTRDGVATFTFTPSRAGRIQITATSQQALRSVTLQVNVIEGSASAAADSAGPAVTLLPPDMPDITSTPDRIAWAGPDAVGATGQPGGILGNLPGLNGPDSGGAPAKFSVGGGEVARQLTVGDFVLSLFGLGLLAGLGFSAGLSTVLNIEGGLRVVLGTIVAGLVGYIYYGLGGPGVSQAYLAVGALAPMIITLGAGLFGLLYTWWLLWRSQA